LKELCEKGLLISDTNCVELLALADLHAATALKRAAMEHIKNNADLIVLSPQWERRVSALSLLHKEIVEALLV